MISSALVIAGLAAADAVNAPPARAATSCGFASPGTGTYASTLCWIDLSGYNAAQAATGQTLTENIPGGYTVSFTLTVTGSAVRATNLPTWSGSYLGNSGHYTGVPGSPALYQTASGTTTATLTNVVVTDRNGKTVRGYSLVGADAEATGPGESITWTSSNPITSLTANSSGNGLGNACGGGFTGVGTTTVKCTGGNANSMTGTAILASTAPSSFSQTMVGGGLEGVAFGVLVSSVQLSKTVVNPYYTSADAFQISVASSDGSTLASADTNGGATATTGPTTVIVAAGGSPFTFAEAATAGTLSDYTQSWSCTRNGATDPALPSGAGGPSATVTVGIGDAVNCTITNAAVASSLSLTKHAGVPVDVNQDGLVDAGDTIAYTFDVTNTGRLPVESIAVSDAKAGAVTCPSTTLAPGASMTCAADASYGVTADDVKGGSVDNTATVSGTPSGSTGHVTSNSSSTRTPTTAPTAGLSVVKSADPSNAQVYTVGQVIAYSFVVTNTGNVPMNDISVADTPFTGTGAAPVPSCPSTTLAPGTQEVCTATYALTQEDVDAGSVTNTAVVSGTPQGSATPVPPVTSTVTIPETPAPDISVVKSANPTTVTTAGQTVSYSFVVTNTGNVTLKNVGVEDAAFSGDRDNLSAIACPETTLVSGQVETCTATYTVTQADVDAGTLTNTAEVTGTPPSGTPLDPVSSNTVTVHIPASPALSIVKTADVTAAAAGEKITYTFTVTNTGNVTITDPQVADTGFTGHGALSNVVCPTGPLTLAPRQVETCTATYTVVQADIDAGSISNAATVTGTPPGGATPPKAETPPVVLPTNPHPALALVKTASSQQVMTVGQVITYTFAITNTGNVTITDPKVNEGAFTGHGTLSAVTCPPGSVLAPGQEIDCTATYTVVAADLAAGGVLSNTATVTGTTPGGAPISSDPSTSKVTEVVPAAPAMGLASTGSDVWAAGLLGLGLLVLGLLAAAAAWLRRRNIRPERD
ncbi:CshA/CshB family fibrillar adhesin-related protein [Humibacter ginsengisoli]